MDKEQALELLKSIQRAFDSRDLHGALAHYHENITYIGPAFPSPVKGIDALRAAFGAHFSSPLRTRVIFGDIGIHEIGDTGFTIHCRIDGIQTVYLSESQFGGFLSRVFVIELGRPRIIHEHFSLAE